MVDASLPPWLAELTSAVEAELRQLQSVHDDPRPRLRAAIAAIEAQRRGWLQSLSNPDLDAVLRRELEQELSQGLRQLQTLQSELTEAEQATDNNPIQIDPVDVHSRLMRLSQLLAEGDVTAANLELSHHIDVIRCYADGRLVMRTCQLGACPTVLEAIRSVSLANRSDRSCAVAEERRGSGRDHFRARRRARLDVRDVDRDEEELAEAIERATELQRFSGVPDEYFWEDEFQINCRASWAEKHSLEVAQFRLDQAATMQATAAHFSKSIPTIRRALRYARDNHGIDALGNELSRPTRKNWARDNAVDVARYFQQPGATMAEAILQFGFSDAWIRNARKRGDALLQEQNDDDSAAPPR